MKRALPRALEFRCILSYARVLRVLFPMIIQPAGASILTSRRSCIGSENSPKTLNKYFRTGLSLLLAVTGNFVRKTSNDCSARGDRA